MSGDVEEYLGAPKESYGGYVWSTTCCLPKAPAGCSCRHGRTCRHHLQPPPVRRPQLTDEQKAAVAKYNEDLKAWRVALPIVKI